MPVVAVQSRECLVSTSRPKTTTMMWPVSRHIYVLSHRFVLFIFYLLLFTLLMIVYRRQPLDAQATTLMCHHLYASPPASTWLTKKKNTLDVTPLGMEAWQESLVGFIYILLFFFYIIDDIYYYSYHNDNNFHSVCLSPHPPLNLAYGRRWWQK